MFASFWPVVSALAKIFTARNGGGVRDVKMRASERRNAVHRFQIKHVEKNAHAKPDLKIAKKESSCLSFY